MNGVSKRVWLLLYQEGGWWSLAEIGIRLNVPRTRWMNLQRGILGDMVRSGFLESKTEPDHQLEVRLRYGVTAKCKVPRGVVLQEIAATLALGAPRAA